MTTVVLLPHVVVVVVITIIIVVITIIIVIIIIVPEGSPPTLHTTLMGNSVPSFPAPRKQVEHSPAVRAGGSPCLISWRWNVTPIIGGGIGITWRLCAVGIGVVPT